MINYSQIQRLALKKGVSEEIIEKDYFIELVLFYIVRNEYFKRRLIFRGGTALKKVYFRDYRFSEDLDFLVQDKGNLAEYEQRLKQLLTKISSDYPFHLTIHSETSKDRLQLYISYDIVPEIKAVKELKIDILRDDFSPSFKRKRILFTYQEFKQEKVALNTYILESVVSDKISRILDVTNEPRDIYDLWYLLKLNINVAKIKEELKRRFGYDIYLPNLLYEINKVAYIKNWQIKLKRQIGNLPDYKKVIKELEGLIEKKLKRL
ncbi:MAG: nucleotidyl transferase AbiEii/AbiGii toxin family protein [Candidatus Cloacimonadota bacterium]|nr:nucleotidyl transferase AbiEii/AbiGii toxin family protein [Candidatus Cloacimonadota bacterium]